MGAAAADGEISEEASHLLSIVCCVLALLARNWTSASDATNAKPSRSMNSTGAAVLTAAPCARGSANEALGKPDDSIAKLSARVRQAVKLPSASGALVSVLRALAVQAALQTWSRCPQSQAKSFAKWERWESLTLQQFFCLWWGT